MSYSLVIFNYFEKIKFLNTYVFVILYKYKLIYILKYWKYIV